jgi:nucleotide-binding universal stress UspA family protein
MSETKSNAILVPLDFSDCSPTVVARAVELAQQEGARIVLMHNVHTPAGIDDDVTVRSAAGEPARALDLLLEEAREGLQDHAEELEAQGIDFELLVTSGDTVPAILRAAEEHEVASIVMGTHGRKGVSRLLLGSVADAVRRGTRREVVAVRSEWKPGCPARGCAWCAAGRGDVERQLEAELDG